MLTYCKFVDLTKLITVAESCTEYSNKGVDQNQEYLLDFDGKERGEPPVPAFCDFSGKTTAVGKNQIFVAEKCNTLGCSREELVYDNIPMTQIRALIENSGDCYQELEIKCSGAPLKVRVSLRVFVTKNIVLIILDSLKNSPSPMA